MSVQGLAFALAVAPIGAQCHVPGFQAWWREDEGWENRESGVFLDSDKLAAHIHAAERNEP